jgi:hypothetical protein
MKLFKSIIPAALVFAFASCVNEPEVDFGVDTGSETGVIEVGPEGGVHTIKISSPGDWVAMTQEPWMTISPANGKGSVECKVIIDSTLKVDTRMGVIRIQPLNDTENKEFTVSQKGFDYQIVAEKNEVSIADYAAFGSRSFDVVLNSNIDFDVVIPENAQNWLSYKKSELVLDRGARPRNVKVSFEWKVNSRAEQRVAEVKFQPKENVTLGRNDVLKVSQGAAEEIPVGTIKGDSLSLIAINRAIGSWQEFDTAEKMENWSNVEVWKDGPNKGRVRKVNFYLFYTKEPIPYEVQNLTALEDLSFYGNTNTFLLNLDTGEHVSKLTQLKRLVIGAYGLTSLHPSFVNLKNLESLNLNGNNFDAVPAVLTPDNFPNLKSLNLTGCTRSTVYDLSNTVKKNIGGFIEENGFPERLLKWDNLDTLRLSVNYLQGELPSMENHAKWTAEEVHATDTLPDRLIGLPKVLPNTRLLSINLNRLYGDAPDWLLYHPNLDLWVPFSLVFYQEGRASNGTQAGFSNEPVSLDYYYQEYKNKKLNPARVEE